MGENPRALGHSTEGEHEAQNGVASPRLTRDMDRQREGTDSGPRAQCRLAPRLQSWLGFVHKHTSSQKQDDIQLEKQDTHTLQR